MIAIQTKYVPWNGSQPARLKAYTANGHTLILSVHDQVFDECKNDDEKHAKLASMLAEKQKWYTPTNYLVGGATCEGMCFVFSDSDIAPKEGPVS